MNMPIIFLLIGERKEMNFPSSLHSPWIAISIRCNQASFKNYRWCVQFANLVAGHSLDGAAVKHGSGGKQCSFHSEVQ